MKVSIRLQNHGKKNHPLWWIVVAPNRKNNFGRFLEHVGYWSPRKGKYLQRRIVLNIPRIKYWLANGAVPTFKVHNFLSLWNIIPAQWRYEKSPEQLAKLQPNQEQLTDKQKTKLKRKMNKKQKEQIDPRNFYKDQAKAYFSNKYQKKLAEKTKAQDVENDILREALYNEKFDAIQRVNKLSNQEQNPIKNITNLKEELKKAKSELALLKKQYINQHPLLQQKLMKRISKMTETLNRALAENRQQILPSQPKPQNEYMTQDLLDKQITYALFTKKIKKGLQQMEKFDKLNQPITVEQYAIYIMRTKKKSKQQAYKMAHREFETNGRLGKILKRMDIVQKSNYSLEKTKYGDDDDESNNASDFYGKLKEFFLDSDIALPSSKPVHPMPDFKSYIPQQYYEPIQVQSFNILKYDSLEPHEQLAKYHEKKRKRVDQL